MAKSGLSPEVDHYLQEATKWKEEYMKLREIVLGSELTEDFKWMHPCYTLNNKNVVIIHGFKEYCALLFHKGSLLPDPHGILIRQSENVQAARQIRFANVQQIIEMEDILKGYIQEAIQVEKAGLKVPVKKHEDYIIPEELESKFIGNPALKTAFEALTPGRQRAYILYFSQAKRAETRESRVDKYTPQILAGKGLND